MELYHQPWELVPNHIRGKGGREIDKFRGIFPAEDWDSGSEAWIGSVTHVGNPPKDLPFYGCSEVILPDGRQMYLFEAISLNPREVLGKTHMEKNGTQLGMLIKYLDAQTQYGLQCHPTRPWAKKMWGSAYGKEESWYVIGTREDVSEPAYILLGFKEGVTRKEWEKYFYADDLEALENLCHKIPVKPGDAFFVGGGCPHALGAGCFVIEVQEPADITLGAHPYQSVPEEWRGKVGEDLFNERLLGAYCYDGCSYEENLRRWHIPRKIFRQGDWGSESVIIGSEQTRYFSFSELDVNGETEILSTGYPRVAIVLDGEGSLKWESGEMKIYKAKELFLPTDIPGLRVEGNLRIILCNPEGVVL